MLGATPIPASPQEGGDVAGRCSRRGPPGKSFATAVGCNAPQGAGRPQTWCEKPWAQVKPTAEALIV